jgi:hypothetical protein
MADLVGSVIAIGLIFFLCSPLILVVYMWRSVKVDIDDDGKEDVPNRW